MPMGSMGFGFWWVFPLGGMVIMGVIAAIVLPRILPQGIRKVLHHPNPTRCKWRGNGMPAAKFLSGNSSSWPTT